MRTMKTIIERLALPILLRGYVPPAVLRKSRKTKRTSSRQASEYALVFDAETAIDAGQTFRVGGYRFYRGEELMEAGLFYDPFEINGWELRTCINFAKRQQLRLRTRDEFVDEVFYGLAYDLRATIIGFNLPYDLSRLAQRWSPARGETMRGGYSLQLSPDPWKARVQVKHLSRRAALIQFAMPRRRFDSRGMRKRRVTAPPRRGAFLDVKTLAAALTSRSFSLETLSDFLQIEHRKRHTDEHGGPITDDYLAYLTNDVAATSDCARALLVMLENHNLTQTRPGQILSEASLGKGYLREANIRPLRDVQPDLPNWLIGLILSAYYGGRSEVRLRRMISQVLYCDFLSMYPTVCNLMRLWQFVIAKGFIWQENTKNVRRFLNHVKLDDLQSSKTWRHFTTLVQVLPDDDVLPVRANYSELQPTIGLNHLKSKIPLWYTLPDCVAAKLLTGKPLNVLRAVTFRPGPMQDELQAITIAGNPAYRIDPRSDDLFRRVIDLRNHVKAKLKKATGSEAERLDTEQQALKILANSTSYGIFVEFVVNSLDEPEARTCFGAGKPFRTSVSKAEAPGRYFYPLLATLITGAARLMLATAETLAAKRGLEWALCDTDSMALAMPAGMVQEEFLRRACKVRDWFTPLNPYGQKGPLFKIEDANYCTSTGQIAPLYCLAISAKRYVLFNLDAYGRPVVRKASAHGLGHLLAPYPEADAPKQIPSPSVSLAEIGVDRWQYDLWYQILTATLAGHPEQVDLTYHPNLSLPAASRYAATTPKLLRWFKAYNQNRPYPQQVKPFNFMLAFQAKPIPTPVQQPGTAGSRKACPVFKPIAPFNQDIQAASQNCFDRETGQPVPASALKSYRQVFASYHLSPESKFLNGDYFDRGPTQRRHIELVTVKYIGKEANKWEAQFHLGFDEDEQVEYGLASQGHRALCRAVSKAANDLKIGQRSLAEQLGVSRATLAKILCGKPVRLSRKTMVKLLRSIGGLRSHAVMASSLRKKAQS